MKKSLVLAFLILGGTTLLVLCNQQPSNCDKVKETDQWLKREITTTAELNQEIDQIIGDSQCDGITPEKLRKVLHDMVKIR